MRLSSALELSITRPCVYLHSLWLVQSLRFAWHASQVVWFSAASSCFNSITSSRIVLTTVPPTRMYLR